MTTTIYDKWQTTFFFNAQANDISGQTVQVSLDKKLLLPAALKAGAIAAAAQLTATLKSAVDSVISDNNTSATPYLGAADWTLVWGPQVLCINPRSFRWRPHYTAKFNAANAMFVVRSASLGRYIVAIAATNSISAYDWLVEDFDTSNVVAWQGALQMWNGDKISTESGAGIPCISQATFTGISNLLSIVDTEITQKTLVGFLKELKPAAGTTLTFTGHSLAGALSPTLALACFDANAGLLKGSAWSVGDAMVYPTAGATPGNQFFASLFNGAGWGGAQDRGTDPWQVWNTDLYNNIDLVPHAWGATMLDAIPGYYHVKYDDIDTDAIRSLVATARAIAMKGEVVAGPYTPINNQALNLTGTEAAGDEFVDSYTFWQGGVSSTEYLTLPEFQSIIPAPTDKTTVSWTQQVLFQHTTAYDRLILQMPPAPLASA